MTEIQIRETHALLAIAVAAERLSHQIASLPHQDLHVLLEPWSVPLAEALALHRAAGFHLGGAACETTRPCGCDPDPDPSTRPHIAHDLF